MASLKEILIHVEQMEDGSFTLSAFDENGLTSSLQPYEKAFVPMA